MDYKKIGNRYYKTEVVEEVESVVKATYNEEDEESAGEYSVCGEWTVEVFLAHATPFDGNTEENYTEIVSELSLA